MSLYSLVEPYLFECFRNLPSEVRGRVSEDFTPESWDALSEFGRYLWTRARDNRNDVERADFARALTHRYWLDLQDEISHVEGEIAELQSLAATDAASVDPSQEVLSLKRTRLELLQKRWYQPDDLTAKEQLAAGRAARDQAPTVVNIPMALHFLSESTGATWMETHLFSLISHSDIYLHAAVPPWTQMELIKWEDARPVALPFIRPGCEILVMLRQEEAEKIWVTGNTIISGYVVVPESVLLDPNSQIGLMTRVKVSRSDLRLTRPMLLSILKKWEESRQPIRPIGPLLPEATTPSTSLPPPPAQSITHKLRTNSLDAPIKKAVERAGSLATGPVYVHLRELALSGEPPFSGITDGDALCYTNDNNEPAKLTKDALSKRLKKHHL